MIEFPPSKEVVASFWQRVNKLSIDSCWIFMPGHRSSCKSVLFYPTRSGIPPDRFSFSLVIGRNLKLKEKVIHSCGSSTPEYLCVRPEHLSLEYASEEERFWSKVDVRGEDDCWEWIASRDNNRCGAGYGGFWWKGKPRGADWVSLMFTNGEEPKTGRKYGLQINHHCDNTLCVNPKHLYIGTAQDNSDDMMGRSKYRLGKAQSTWKPSRGNTKLKEAEVRKIRRLYAAGGWTLKELGKKFSVHYTTIQTIISGVNWNWLV